MSNVPDEVREAIIDGLVKSATEARDCINEIRGIKIDRPVSRAIFQKDADAALSALEAAGWEVNRKGTLNNVRAELTARAKEMQSARDTLIWVRDEMEDEGDRVYFGSTNHAEQFREVVESMDEWSWHDIMRASRDTDYETMSDRRDQYDPFFLDLAEEGAQFGLLCLMTGISEECWAAGWMNGLEHYLWRVAQGGERGYGMQTITERQATLLKLLSEEADGWWVWDDDGPRFISLTAWNGVQKEQA